MNTDRTCVKRRKCSPLHLLDLPTEILAHILSYCATDLDIILYLRSCCRTFYQLMPRCATLKGVSCFPELTLQRVSRIHRFVKSISIDNLKFCREGYISPELENFSHHCNTLFMILEKGWLTHLSVSSDFLYLLMDTKLNSLKKVTVSGCEATLDAQNLQPLNCIPHVELRSVCLSTAGDSLQPLSTAKHITLEKVLYRRHPSVNTLICIDALKDVPHITLKDVGVKIQCVSLSVRELEMCQAHLQLRSPCDFRHLQRLRLFQAANISTCLLYPLTNPQHLTNIQHLTLESVYNVVAGRLHILSRGNIQRLKLINIDDITDISALSVSGCSIKHITLRDLRKLKDVSGLRNIHRVSLYDLPSVDNVSSLKTVQRLKLYSLLFVRDVNSLGDVPHLTLQCLPVTDISMLAASPKQHTLVLKILPFVQHMPPMVRLKNRLHFEAFRIGGGSKGMSTSIWFDQLLREDTQQLMWAQLLRENSQQLM